ncbi:tetraacyldisaccharide 4'-kinase [soil metagenome]
MSSISTLIHSCNPFLYILYPISLLFRAVTRTRRWLYQCGVFTQTKVAVPVIVVGNISVGGTGKTPLVISLANLLISQGFKPGIITRGYKSKSKSYPLVVNDSSIAAQVGDEALLLQRHSHCPVIVDPIRVRAANYLLQHYSCDIILSDDGLQHYALARDIEIAVVDAARGFGNGLCLPAGPLREPVSRLQDVDFIINNVGRAHVPALGSDTMSVPQSTEGEGTKLFTYSMYLQPQKFLNLSSKEQQDAAFFQHKTLHAIAGIGNPQRFFQTLKDLGLTANLHAFPDHHAFTAADIDFGADAIVIMTEKDAVKCKDFADKRHWYLPVTAQLQQGFAQQFFSKLSQQTVASSLHTKKS